MNREGYKDPTAEIAISRVTHEKDGVFDSKKRRKRKDGRKRCTQTEEGQTLRQHQT